MQWAGIMPVKEELSSKHLIRKVFIIKVISYGIMPFKITKDLMRTENSVNLY